MRALTYREAIIVRRVADGMPDAEIARLLFLDEAAVVAYVDMAMDKLEVADRSELVERLTVRRARAA